MDSDIISQAEQFIVKVVSKKHDSCTTFNELRVKLYHQSMEKRFIDLHCSSNAVQHNIKRAYLQTKMWLEAPFGNAAETMDPGEFGYIYNLTEDLIEPRLFIGPARPVDVPEPCICKTCLKKTCNCRVAKLPCSDYCGCADNHSCKNPH